MSGAAFTAKVHEGHYDYDDHALAVTDEGMKFIGRVCVVLMIENVMMSTPKEI